MKFSHRIMILIFLLAILFASSSTLLVSWKTHEKLAATQNEWIKSLINAMSESIALNVIDRNKLRVEEQLNNVVNNESSLDYAFIIDFEGNLFAHTFNNEEIPRFLLPRLSPNIKNAQRYSTNQGNLDDIAHQLIEGMDATLHLGVNHSGIDQVITSTKQEIISLSLMVGLLGTFIAVFLSNKISAPLKHLRGEMLTYGRGNEVGAIKLGTKDQEFIDVASAFNSMIYDRNSMESAYKKSEMHIRLLMNSTAEGIFGLDLRGNCIFANKSCLKQLGYIDETDLLNEHMHDLMHHSYKDGTQYPATDCPINKNIKNEEIHVDNEVFWRKDRSHFPVEYWSHPIIENNKCTGTVITFVDIAERKEIESKLQEYHEDLENKVSERTVELETAIRELESFSYSVSHDLRAPLRGMKGFSQVLLEDYQEKLDNEGQDYLNRIANGAQHMSLIIDDLLSLAQITKSDVNKKSIELSELSKKIIFRLQDQEPDRKIDIQIEQDIFTNGDEKLLDIALTNIFSNAWKFTKKTANPEIKFGKIDYNDNPVFFIRDNGAGFDNQYVNKIFGAFQRLHKKEEFEGTGIGLATVSRVIHRHGGQIWADSKIGKGATFYFTLSPGDTSNFQEIHNKEILTEA